MRTEIYELTGASEKDIRRVEKALGLHEGTVNTDAAPPRASENGDFFVRIGFIDHGKRLS